MPDTSSRSSRWRIVVFAALVAVIIHNIIIPFSLGPIYAPTLTVLDMLVLARGIVGLIRRSPDAAWVVYVGLLLCGDPLFWLAARLMGA